MNTDLKNFAENSNFEQAGGIEIDIFINDLDAAIKRCLSGFINSRFERFDNGPDFLYLLAAGGEIKISRIDSHRSMLIWQPPQPQLPIFIALEGIETAKRITAEQADNFSKSVKFMLIRLANDPVLSEFDKQQTGPPPKQEIPPHPLKKRREKVLELTLAGESLKEIAKAIDEPNNENLVKQDRYWLRDKGFLS